MLAPLLAGVVMKAEPLLTPADLAALDRENEMWRRVDARQDVAANVATWRAAGFREREVAELARKLEELWTVEVERQFGWLPYETVERIRGIDEEFTIRLRAARLKEVTGIQPVGVPAASALAVQWHWQRALLRALEHEELTEFRLMNSPSARQLYGRTRGLLLTEGEWRTMCEWQREFDLTYGFARRRDELPAGGADRLAG